MTCVHRIRMSPHPEGGWGEVRTPEACCTPRSGAIILGTTQTGFGLKSLSMVVRPLGVDTRR